MQIGHLRGSFIHLLNNYGGKFSYTEQKLEMLFSCLIILTKYIRYLNNDHVCNVRDVPHFF